MTVIQISDALAEEISNEARTRGLAIEDFLKAVVRRERTLADRRKIEQEQAWWLSLPLSERAQFEGKFVAVQHQQVVDSDPAEIQLYQRVRARYGNQAALVMPAAGPRDINLRSPRVISE